jgi:enoyl-CoA hydratase/carnithine racemase
MLLVGEAASCADAVAFGLVNRSAPTSAELDELVSAVAGKIASKSTYTVAVGKKAFYSQLEKGLDGAYREANVVMTSNMMARDAKEGITAFVSKRDPSWEDR